MNNEQRENLEFNAEMQKVGEQIKATSKLYMFIFIFLLLTILIAMVII